MPHSSPVFAQIMGRLDPTEFARCVQQYPMKRSPRGLSAYDHFLALCFGQLTGRESLRDLIACLNARVSRTYPLGFRTNLSRTNLAYANEHRDWRVFAAVAQVLMRRAQRLYAQAPADPELPNLTYALDASLIDLSLALFPWAYFQPTVGAIKLHLLLALKGNVPAWAAVTEANCPDQKSLDQLPLNPRAFYVMDRGYLDFPRLARLHQAEACFVVRAKCHLRFRVLQSRGVDKSRGLRCDQTIRLTTVWSRRAFPHLLRRVRVRDEEQKRSLVLLTNNFQLPAIRISELYRRRWQVELFFKWIKQHLRLRAFFGRSANAVRARVWAAIAAYLLVAIAKQQLHLPQTLHQILQIISVSAFEQVPLPELFTDNHLENFQPNDCKQLIFNAL